MSSPLQPLDPITPPDPVTPHDTPSNPAGYAQVYPHGIGPAPYNIQAPVPDVTGAFAQSVADNGDGFLYPASQRQHLARVMMDSAAGFGVDGFDIQAGSTAGWPADVEPGG